MNCDRLSEEDEEPCIMAATRFGEWDDTDSDTLSAPETLMIPGEYEQRGTDEDSTCRVKLVATGGKIEETSSSDILDGHLMPKTAVLPYLSEISRLPNCEYQALRLAAAADILEAVSLLLEFGVDVNAVDDNGNTALHIAAFAGCVESIKLVEAGASLTAQNSKGHSVFHWAVRSRNTAALSLLKDLGADVNSADRKGHTPLHTALASGFQEGFDALMDLGANPFVSTPDGVSLLHTAAGKGNTSAVRALLQAGVGVDARNAMHGTALHEAASGGHVRCAEILLDAGIHTECRDDLGRTPLHLAASYRHVGVIVLLLQRGADVDSASVDLDTALHMAALAGDRKTVEILIGAGADVNARNAEGSTPLHVAIAERHDEVAEYILSLRRSDLDVADGGGLTPLHLTAVNGVASSAAALVAAATLSFTRPPRRGQGGQATKAASPLGDGQVQARLAPLDRGVHVRPGRRTDAADGVAVAASFRQE
ncbi:serine/threonine-protein phosphatase 6 regulatory ankyrin repeat subunit B-like [Schistocerca nitens]|uniref:serine/threonine-protein phosphatase 6 regulatory ankyrin repeat subunit B-like n=1 Tax=Schistocerca nitens TaxID=7011 RepID=UPI0021194541|nr:serine/threonine-protein phosphatase 6 regulatory ankyrin repeat subunit B-like [Schistocerca nitens]